MTKDTTPSPLSEADRNYLRAKWAPHPMESKENHIVERERLIKLIAPQWAEKMNEEYGLHGLDSAYLPQDMAHDEQLEALHPGEDNNRAPLTTDLFTFVYWLRKNTDFFSGPDLNCTFPDADSPEFYEVLAQNALLYTEE